MAGKNKARMLAAEELEHVLMYQPVHFHEDRLDVQQALIQAHPLGLLITAGAGGLMANPVPFQLDSTAGPYGTLRAHLARANPQWQELAALEECLVVFQGPQAYITPSWYATKQATGKVVPTWNYAIVQARGRPRIVEDAAWLLGQLHDLTEPQEAPRAMPWHVDDAPAEYVAGLMRAIVGVEIPIARLDGKWKMSQNRPAADQAGVVAGLHAEDRDAVADLVEERRKR